MIYRDLTPRLEQAAKYFSAVAVLGPRQSGKTTLVKFVFPKHGYVSLEDIDRRMQANDDPRAFLKNYRNEFGVILDEIQHAPNLLSYIQTIIDEEKKMGYFVITGSQNLLVGEAVTQTLAGRLALLTLFPLSINELKQVNLLPNNIEEAVFKGGYPRVYADNVPAEILYRNYISGYVERDVRQVKNILDLSLFQKFLQLCAGRIGQVLNLSSLGNDCGVDHKTVSAWISLLESTYVIFLLQPYYKNIGRQLIKSPKLYFADTGIVCSLLNIKFQEELFSHYAYGSIVESFIISDFYKQYYNDDQKPAVYFWRDYQGNEIDCVIDKALSLTPIEIKAGQTVNKSYFKQFEYWTDVVKDSLANKFVVYGGDQSQTWSLAEVISWKDAGELISRA